MGSNVVVLDPIKFHCIDKSDPNIIQNVLFCVPQIHSGLE